MRGFTLFAIVLGTGLLSCCTPRVQSGALPAPAAEEIRLSRGPCFGFCPVYSVAVTPAGRVDFKGERHTAVLGARSHTVGRTGYEDVRRALAPVRPKTSGESTFSCVSGAPTDMSSLTIEWIAANGGRTALTYRMGCRDEAGREIERKVEEQLRRLEVEAWAAQKTWPGDTRG